MRKKYILTALAAIATLASTLSPTVQAQDWEAANHFATPTAIFNINANYAKAITEVTQGTDNNTGYAYMEGAFGLNDESTNYFYTQLFWEQKFWEAPIFFHAEFRTTLWDGEFNNNYYFGGAYCQYFTHGMLAYEPLARYNKFDGIGYQFSLVGGWDWKWCDLAHFTDIWGSKASDGKPNSMYNEVRFYIKLSRRLEMGCVATLSYEPAPGWSKSLLGAVKINL